MRSNVVRTMGGSRTQFGGHGLSQGYILRLIQGSTEVYKTSFEVKERQHEMFFSQYILECVWDSLENMDRGSWVTLCPVSLLFALDQNRVGTSQLVS